jgi:hypothetical protein
MKKRIYFLAILLIGIAIVSCDKVMVDESIVNLKTAYIEQTSTPTSSEGIVPVILGVDKPRGGNVTCNDVSQAYGNVPLVCGDKVNYTDVMQFESSFPEWLHVDLNGIYISFKMDECVKIGDKYYKVGAVIVKGSNAANVYFYEGGILSDSHLAAPGDKPMVSNLTFCFVECAQNLPEVTIVVKAFYGVLADGTWSTYRYTLSTGTNVYTVDNWCSVLGINNFPAVSSFALSEGVGTVNMEVAYPENVRSLIITVDLNDGLTLDETYLYVGSLAGLGSLSTCPDYTSWPFTDSSNSNSVVFTVPY